MRALTMQIDMNVHCRAMNLERKGRFIEGRYKSAYDGDKDGSGDNANGKCIIAGKTFIKTFTRLFNLEVKTEMMDLQSV